MYTYRGVNPQSAEMELVEEMRTHITHTNSKRLQKLHVYH